MILTSGVDSGDFPDNQAMQAVGSFAATADHPNR